MVRDNLALCATSVVNSNNSVVTITLINGQFMDKYIGRKWYKNVSFSYRKLLIYFKLVV